MTALLLPLALGLGFVFLEMTLTFFVARRLRNFGIVDAVWSFGFGPIALLWLAATPRATVASDAPIRWFLLTGLVLVWSGRLGTHLGLRIAGHHPTEDVRYAELRKKWGGDVDRRMYGFYLLQGVLQVVLALPFLLVHANGHPAGAWAGLSPWEWAGTAFWMVGICGEAVADVQLTRFRSDPARRGQVCREGLWRYSRHPNYFFEWLVWVGFALFATGSPLGWLGWLSPLLMAHFLINVTGIPMTEALSVQKRGEAYREYQRTTSAFFPWFPRRP